jgi:exopolysaccharide biosynthesis predicted pyruvyltransferase EpsI
MKRLYLLCEPTHANLGDQAQLMCTLKWLKENFPYHKVVMVGYMFGAFDIFLKTRVKDILVLLKYAWLKLTVRKDDIFIGHSGYFFVDHHIGWTTLAFIQKYFPNNRMIILPQTVNFYSPVAKQLASRCFGNNDNITLLCRDKVSFDNAKELFGSTKLLLFPDIVTSLIGSKHYDGKREGVLFCMRGDVEAYYKPEQIDALMVRFGNVRMEKTDTTLHNISTKGISKNRNNLIWQTIDKFASYQAVITDRYHGTIFSAIASTPVIVINSADHKLSSGVSWFPKDQFGDYVQFANDLDEAYDKAMAILNRTDLEYKNPPYFKNEYWDRLLEILTNNK